MKAGICLATEEMVGGDITAKADLAIEVTRRARDYGFHSVQAGQHFAHHPMQILQPLPLLGRVAAESGDMHVGTCILLLTLLHPVDVAEQVATLDHLTGGKFIFGIGLGYLESEFHAFGLDKKRRVSRFEESLAVIKNMWTEECFDFDGEHFSLQGITPSHRPKQSPHPPVWIAANNHPAVKRAARLGDAWYANPHATFETIREQVTIYDGALEAFDRPSPQHRVLMREIYVAKDRETALRECRPGLANRFDVYVTHGQDGEMPAGDDNFDQDFEALTRDRMLIGSPDDCLEELTRFRELGFDYVVFDFHWPGIDDELALKNLKMIGEQVLPELNAL